MGGKWFLVNEGGDGIAGVQEFGGLRVQLNYCRGDVGQHVLLLANYGAGEIYLRTEVEPKLDLPARVYLREQCLCSSKEATICSTGRVA